MPSSIQPHAPDFRTLFESAPGLYLVLTPDLKIVGASDAYLRATKTLREQIVGRGLFEVFPDNPDDSTATGVDNLRSSLQRVVRNKVADAMAVQKYDIQRPISEGGGFEERHWSPMNSPVLGPDGEILYIIHRVEDVTEFLRVKQQGVEQSKLTEELRSHAQRMEAEVFQRAQQLQEVNRQLRGANAALASRDTERTELYERLKKLDDLKTRFFANVSHELRTPLTLILGPVEKMLVSEGLSAETRRLLELVRRNAQTLLVHVNELLDIARLEAGKMAADYVELDLADLVRQAAAHFELLASERRLAYPIEVPQSLVAQFDPAKVKRILLNLLSNAFKFTPAGGTIRCTLEAGSGRAAVLTVADSGPGVPVEMRERIFDRFFQVEDSSTRAHGGTGLGLAIVKEFVGLHGGTIEALEAPEGGACFRVTLPTQAPAGSSVRHGDLEKGDGRDEQALIELRSVEPAAEPKRYRVRSDAPLVLVVEDHRELNALIGSALAAEYRVASAFDGVEGLEAASTLRPDLILCDVMMPRMSGEDLILEIRKRREFDEVPIIVLTARIDEELRVRLLRSGAQDCLGKPFSAREVLARVSDQIARKKRAESALKQSEARFRQLAENIPEVFWMTSLDMSEMLYVSPAYESIWGRSVKVLQLRPADWTESILPEDRAAAAESFASLSRGAPAVSAEYRIRRPDGSIRWILDRGFPIKDPSGRPIRLAGVATDITERKRLEENLRRSQKLEAIGQLASGIAHDFNNILGCIVGYAEMATLEAAGNADAQANIQGVLGASQRAKELILQILTFSTPHERAREATRLQPLLHEALSLLRASLPSTIETRLEIAEEAPPILADATQIRQVIMNLATNSAQAMSGALGGKGRLTIGLEVLDVDAEFARLRNLQPGRHVSLVVTDTGCGMDPETLERMFEPFFTTKAPGEGTGLGLAVVHGIVKSHEGAIAVYSELGRGTAFHVYFPALEATAESEIARGQEVARGNGERVLLVDDEPSLVALGRKMLELAGYRVSAHTDAEDALSEFRSGPERFDLVITDLTMPKISGGELVREFLKIRPDIPIILATGLGSSVSAAKAQAMGIRELITKPATARCLVESVQRALKESKVA